MAADRRISVLVGSMGAAALAAVAAVALSCAWTDSATFDEPVHVASGYLKLTRGQFDYYREQPPLTDSLAALPLLAREVHLPEGWGRADQWAFGKAFLYRAGNDADAMLFWARVPSVLLLLGLCVVVFRWIAWATGDAWLALAGLVLTGFCPNLVAHGHLVTGDIGLSFFAAAAGYGFQRLLLEPRRRDVVLTGAALAGALLSKISGLVLLPYLGCSVVVHLVVGRALGTRPIVRWRHLLGAVAVACACIEAFYLAELRGGPLAAPWLAYQSHLRAVADWVSGSGRLAIVQYLNGRFSTTGWWYYFLEAFALKTPVPVLLLTATALGVLPSLFLRSRAAPDRGARVARAATVAVSSLAFVLGFFAATFVNAINIGLRYVLPIYPFLFVFLACTARWAMQAWSRRRAVGVAVASATLLQIAVNLAAFPSYLGYFNLLAGSRSPDAWLLDSNLDWGQDLKRLARWVEANGIQELTVLYFGGADVRYHLPASVRVREDLPRRRAPGYFAVSKQLYWFSTSGFFGGVDLARYLEGARRVATVGTSIDVYRVDEGV